jgi:hypothetical protein
MLMVKLNLCPNVGGLAFRIETLNALPRIAWEAGAVAVDANDVLNIEYREDHSERKEAEEWLREFLADGPVAASEAIKEASAVGITRTTLHRAGRALGIVRRKLGGRGAGWEWSLQESKNSGFIYAPVDSLNSLNSQVKTNVDSRTQDPKISAEKYMGTVKSLPLPVDGGDGEADGEIRL